MGRKSSKRLFVSISVNAMRQFLFSPLSQLFLVFLLFRFPFGCSCQIVFCAISIMGFYFICFPIFLFFLGNFKGRPKKLLYYNCPLRLRLCRSLSGDDLPVLFLVAFYLTQIERNPFFFIFFGRNYPFRRLPCFLCNLLFLCVCRALFK